MSLILMSPDQDSTNTDTYILFPAEILRAEDRWLSLYPGRHWEAEIQ